MNICGSSESCRGQRRRKRLSWMLVGEVIHEVDLSEGVNWWTNMLGRLSHQSLI